MSLNTQTSSNF